MPITWQEILGLRRMALAPPIAWAIGVASIVSVFAVVAIIVNYAPLNSDAEQRVRTELTPATYETITMVINATGNSCARICSIAAEASLTTTTSLDVACAVQGVENGCVAPVHYRVNVDVVDGPQR